MTGATVRVRMGQFCAAGTGLGAWCSPLACGPVAGPCTSVALARPDFVPWNPPHDVEHIAEPETVQASFTSNAKSGDLSLVTEAHGFKAVNGVGIRDALDVIVFPGMAPLEGLVHRHRLELSELLEHPAQLVGAEVVEAPRTIVIRVLEPPADPVVRRVRCWKPCGRDGERLASSCVTFVDERL